MRIPTLCAIPLLLLFGVAAGAEPTVQTLLDGLNNPCAVALQPGTGHIFVSDSAAGRIVRVVDGQAQDVIVNFPQDVYGKGPMYNIGPLGLAFIGENTLVVGGGGQPDGKELLRVYEIPEAGSEPIDAKEMKASFTLPPTDEIKGEGNFYGVVANDQWIYVTCNGDDTKGWVARGRIKEGNISNFKRWLATKEAVEVDAPVGITLSPDGELVVGQGGEVTLPEDALVTFYNAENGKKLLNLSSPLFDITGLAYSPGGQLYATDFAWMDTKQGGLFQMIAPKEDGDQTITAKKILELDKPTAIVFDKSGAAYVTVMGTVSDNNKTPGKLLKVTF